MDTTEARRGVEEAVAAAIRSGGMSQVEVVNAATAAAVKTVYEMTQDTAKELYSR